MSRAVRYDGYGGIDVLHVVEVERPTPAGGQVVVRVKAAGINPGEANIREGRLAELWPSTFPSGQGSDFAGIVEEVATDVHDIVPGDEVIGFTDDRASHADFVVVPAEQLTPKPSTVSWEVAGSLFVAGTTAFAVVRAVALRDGETVVVSGAAGGVGTLTVQLARNLGARVLGLASDRHHAWLEQHGVIPIAYGDGVEARIRDAAGGTVDAFIDTFGSGYVKLAIDLGVAPDRIDTIADRASAAKYGVKTAGNADAASADVLHELASLVGKGILEVPIAKVYPLDAVQDAYRELEERHTIGKIVLVP